jgi:exosome complex component RRP42
MDARITITTNSDHNFAAIQKGSTGAFTVEQLKRAAATARIKGEEIRVKIMELTKPGK